MKLDAAGGRVAPPNDGFNDWRRTGLDANDGFRRKGLRRFDPAARPSDVEEANVHRFRAAGCQKTCRNVNFVAAPAPFTFAKELTVEHGPL